MKRQRPQENYFDQIDEHDQPTDPMLPVVIAPFAPTQANGNPRSSAYPYLPPAPSKKNGSYNAAPGGTPANAMNPAYPILPARPAQQAQPKVSPVPALIGFLFVLLQVLLLARFLLKLLNVSGSTLPVSVIYTISGLFVFPFRLLLQSVAITLPVSVEVYTLLAILVYGLFSRILVRFLKALLHSR